jgi:hypothetical protein
VIALAALREEREAAEREEEEAANHAVKEFFG